MTDEAPLAFTATQFASERTREDSEYFFDGWIVALGGDDEERDALIITLADDFDEQDERLGMDTYCLVWGAQHGTVYGGVSRAVVSEGSVTFQLEPASAVELGVPELFRIDFPAQRTGEVREGLTHTLGSGVVS